jgi:hypothetical protein
LNRSALPFCQGLRGFCPPVFGAEIRHGLGESSGPDVGEGVVGHDFLHGCPAGGHELSCVGQESGAGGAFLIGVDLDVGQAGMVVHGDVDVVEADAAALDAFAAAVDAPASAFRDFPEFLDVSTVPASLAARLWRRISPVSRSIAQPLTLRAWTSKPT